MTDAVGKEIVIEGVDPRELYGPKDAYLDQIRALIHISEPTRPRLISYAVFCLKKKKKPTP